MQYNQDLDGCMGGRSIGGISVLSTGSGSLIMAQSQSAVQRSVTIVNRDAAITIYFNYALESTGATTANATLRAGEAIKINTRNNVWGFADSGTPLVDAWTEEG